MADTCPSCLLLSKPENEPFHEGKHCPRWFTRGENQAYVQAAAERDCLHLGLQLRDAKLAALTERTKAVLRRVVAELDGALGEQPAVELQMHAEVDPEGLAPGSEGFARDLPGEEVPIG